MKDRAAVRRKGKSVSFSFLPHRQSFVGATLRLYVKFMAKGVTE